MEKLKEWLNTVGENLTKQRISPELVAIKDLPVYRPDDDLSDYRFVEAKPLLFQESVHTSRVAVQDTYDQLTEKFGTIQNAVDGTVAAYQKAKKYWIEEDTTIPKAVLITVSGLAGFLFGKSRGGRFKQVTYTAIGLVIMGGACYPQETLDVSRTVYTTSSTEVKRLWSSFSDSPPPPKVESSENKESQGKAKDEN